MTRLASGTDRRDVETYYDRRWRRRQRLNVPRILRHRQILRFLRRYGPRSAGQGLEIVELGCGPGDLAARLARFGRVTAIDLSRATLEANRRRIASVDFRWGDVAEPGLANELGTFDVAVTSEVAEHIELASRQQFFGNLAQLVRPGGTLILTTPDRQALEEAGRPLSDDQPVNNLFDREELWQWLRRDFELLARIGVHPLVRTRGLDVAWKLMLLPVGYWGAGALASALDLPTAYQVLALQRRDLE